MSQKPSPVAACDGEGGETTPVEVGVADGVVADIAGGGTVGLDAAMRAVAEADAIGADPGVGGKGELAPDGAEEGDDEATGAVFPFISGPTAIGSDRLRKTTSAPNVAANDAKPTAATIIPPPRFRRGKAALAGGTGRPAGAATSGGGANGGAAILAVVGTATAIGGEAAAATRGNPKGAMRPGGNGPPATIAAKASAMSCIVGRSAGVLANIRDNTRSSAGGASGLERRTEGTGCERWARIFSTIDSPA
jgi:hypothetical protein